MVRYLFLLCALAGRREIDPHIYKFLRLPSFNYERVGDILFLHADESDYVPQEHNQR